MLTAAEIGAGLIMLLGLALLNLAETALVGILFIAVGCYVLLLPRFIDPRATTSQ